MSEISEQLAASGVPHVLHSPLKSKSILRAHRPFLEGMGAVMVGRLADTKAASTIAQYAHLFDPDQNDLNISLLTMARAEYVIRDRYLPEHTEKAEAVAAYNKTLIASATALNKERPQIPVSFAQPAIQVIRGWRNNMVDKYLVHLPVIAEDLSNDYNALQARFNNTDKAKSYHPHLTIGVTNELESAHQLGLAAEEAGLPELTLSVGQITLAGGIRPKCKPAPGAVEPIY